jgi:hypothetical protein
VRTLSVPSEASVRVGIVRKAYAYAYYLTGAHLRRGPRSRYEVERLTDNARKYAKNNPILGAGNLKGLHC